MDNNHDDLRQQLQNIIQENTSHSGPTTYRSSMTPKKTNMHETKSSKFYMMILFIIIIIFILKFTAFGSKINGFLFDGNGNKSHETEEPYHEIEDEDEDDDEQKKDPLFQLL